MPPQDSFDQNPHLRPDSLSDRPVDGHIVPHGAEQLLGDDAKRFVAENLHGAVVHLQCVIEGNLILCESERFPSATSLAHVLGEGNQLLDDLGGFDGPVLVSPNRALEQLGERPRLNNVFPAARLDFTFQQLAEQLHRQVALWQTAYLGQELV